MTDVERDVPECKMIAGVSVVIAWVNSAALLRPGLRALLEAQTTPPAEILVATRHAEYEVAPVQTEFPSVHFIRAAPGTTIPQLRAQAIRQSRGRFVAVTEDHCTPCEDWVERIERRLSREGGVVGGCIENGSTKRLRDWAAFLTEYAGALSPAKEGPTHGLPGNNVAYTRRVCDGLVAVLEDQRWESFYHAQVVQRGDKLHLDPAMIVWHVRPFDFFYFLAQRFHFCRSYAVMRWSSPSWRQRLVYGLGCAVLPLLLWCRSLRILVEKRRHIGMYFVCTPLIVPYLIAGAIGEAVGYWVGGGCSLERVE